MFLDREYDGHANARNGVPDYSVLPFQDDVSSHYGAVNYPLFFCGCLAIDVKESAFTSR